MHLYNLLVVVLNILLTETNLFIIWQRFEPHLKILDKEPPPKLLKPSNLL